MGRPYMSCSADELRQVGRQALKRGDEDDFVDCMDELDRRRSDAAMDALEELEDLAEKSGLFEEEIDFKLGGDVGDCECGGVVRVIEEPGPSSPGRVQCQKCNEVYRGDESDDDGVDAAAEERSKARPGRPRAQKSRPAAPRAKKKEEGPKLDQVQAELDALVGMQAVKSQVRDLIASVEYRKRLRESGLPEGDPLTLHAAFLGPPGTGKTTVARILGRVYASLGLLSGTALVRADRSSLVADHMGGTEKKVRKVIESARGGVLFIDEAYSLAQDQADAFGQAALQCLVLQMEHERANLAVILAGYGDETRAMIRQNVGLASRIPTFFEFEHYSPEELRAIFEATCKPLKLTCNPDAKKAVFELLHQAHALRTRAFGNGRLVRNLLDSIRMHIARRVAQAADSSALTTITRFDVPSSFEAWQGKTCR